MNLNKWKDARWYPNTIAICSGVLLYFALQHLNLVGSLFSGIWTLIRPLVLAIVFAFLVNPLCMYFENHLFSRFLDDSKQSTRWKLSVFTGFFTIVLVVVLLLLALIPQLLASIVSFLENFSSSVVSLEIQLNKLVSSLGQAGIDLNSLNQAISKALDSITGFLTQGDFLTKSQEFGAGFSNFFIAFILAIYFLASKNALMKGFSRLMKRLLGESLFHRCARFAGRCNTILTRYLVGTIGEGLLVGFINAVFMLLAGMPYIPVVSIVVGVTNLAPTFGPIVGCIIGMFILLLSKPIYALYFLLFTLVLQTIDGYIIKPKLFGDSLGVSPLLILISIILGGKMFGVVGILFAIPFAAILGYAVTEFVLPGTIRSLAEQESTPISQFFNFRRPHRFNPGNVRSKADVDTEVDDEGFDFENVDIDEVKAKISVNETE